MLSNQQNRQQQSGRPLASRLINHERQRSTPTTPLLNLESTGCFPERYTQGFLQQQQQPKPQQRQAPTHHRRGLSLDPSMRLQELRLTNTRSPLGNNGMITTNQGPIYQQQKMRETQIPGPARPGQIEHSFGNTIQNSEMIHDICADFGMAIPLNDNVTSCYAPMIVPSGVPNHETPQIRPYTPNNLRMNCM